MHKFIVSIVALVKSNKKEKKKKKERTKVKDKIGDMWEKSNQQHLQYNSFRVTLGVELSSILDIG